MIVHYSLSKVSETAPVDDLCRAEALLIAGDAQAAALVACVALERRLRKLRALNGQLRALSGLRAFAVALRREGVIDREQSQRLRWINARRNRLVHGRAVSDVGAEALVRHIAAFLIEVETRDGSQTDA